MGIEDKLKDFEKWEDKTFLLMDDKRKSIFFYSEVYNELYINDKYKNPKNNIVINEDYSVEKNLNKIDGKTILVFYNREIYFRKEKLNEETKGFNGIR